MRILRDENMPRKLVVALEAQGYEVDSVKLVQLGGIDQREKTKSGHSRRIL